MAKEDTSDTTPTEEGNRPQREEIQPVQGHIAIKGTRNGLLLTLEPETPFSDLINALANRLAEAPSFFRGASLAVDTSQRLLRVSERIQLEKLLAHYQMSVSTLEKGALLPEAYNPNETIPPILRTIPPPETETPQAIRPLSEAMPEKRERDLREVDDTLFLRRTIRSGQAIHHTSSVVILGDVNAGAEIIAGGDIIVWGVLRGMVHAGYPNNDNALVCSLLLAPVQLRIAHLLSRPPEGTDVQPRPEVASIKNGRIVVETWLNGRPPRK